MTTFAASETRLRRFLRDPDALIWSSADIQEYYNDAQIELATKTGMITRVEAHYYPPRYDYSYLYDWEQTTVEGDRYRCLEYGANIGRVQTYNWEAGYYLSTITTPDDGYRMTQPWESVYGEPADPQGVLLHSLFDRMKFIAYDCDPILPITRSELEKSDPYYRTRSGEVSHYWRPDDYSNLIYPYPRPSTVVWQEPDTSVTMEDAGGISSSAETYLDEEDTGITTDIINISDAFFMVYDAQPTEIRETTDESDFEDYLTKYIEYAVLERAFGADTDGFIPSLRDYWKLRKEIGIKTIQRFKRNTLTDRNYRLGGNRHKPASTRLRLPDHYPAI